MRVRTNDGKEGMVVMKSDNMSISLVRFGNGRQKYYNNNQLTELKSEQPAKPPSRERDRLLLTIKTIEKMHKTASESKTDFAQGAEMAYSLVLDMLNRLK